MVKEKKQKAFTLIELLVVMSIISLLASAGFSTYNTARKKSRDAHRIEEIKAVQTALELYYGKNGSYPTTLPIGGFVVSNFPTWNSKVGLPLVEYFPGGAPLPPKGTSDPYNYAYITSEFSSVCIPAGNGKYYYLPQSNARQGYILWVNRESVPGLFTLAGGNVQVKDNVNCI